GYDEGADTHHALEHLFIDQGVDGLADGLARYREVFGQHAFWWKLVARFASFACVGFQDLPDLAVLALLAGRIKVRLDIWLRCVAHGASPRAKFLHGSPLPKNRC